MASVRVHPAAEAEYRAALAWYQARSPQATVGFADGFRAGLGLLGATPEVGSLIDDDHRRTQLGRFPYGLVYRYESGVVLVVGVTHDRQLGGGWAGRT